MCDVTQSYVENILSIILIRCVLSDVVWDREGCEAVYECASRGPTLSFISCWADKFNAESYPALTPVQRRPLTCQVGLHDAGQETARGGGGK